MPLSGTYQKNKFHIGDIQGYVKRAISAADVTKQQAILPFHKTCLEDSHDIDRKERARLTLLVKWYIIEAGLATDHLVGDTEAYAARLRNALEYVATRIGTR